MNIYLLNPIKGLIKESLVNKLAKYGKVIKDEEVKPLLEVEQITDPEVEKIIAIDPDYCNWKFPKETLDKIPNVKTIIISSTSFSWIDVHAAEERDIPVINTRNFSTNAVAEWAMMMALNTYRKVPLLIKENFKLDYERYQGIELKEKTVGIIGMGNIGTRLAEIAAGMGMKVIYWSKNTVDNRYDSVSLPKLFSSAHIVFPTLAQNEETKNIITDEMLNSLRPDSVFVSVVHHIYNQELLLDLVAKKKIYGYAFEDEASSFGKYKGNVWAAPALAWCTAESMERNATIWGNNIIKALEGDFSGRVN